MAQPEYDKVERPLIEQLVAMGWEHLQGASPGAPANHAADSERAYFTEVVYAKRFRTAVARINPGPSGHGTWLTDAQLDHLLALLHGRVHGQGPTGHGVAGNLEVTRMLRDGINARTVPGWTKGDPEYIRLVDWDGDFAVGNDLLAVSQFRVERSKREPATPDIVLFVNGLPWVIIECKAPVTKGRDSRSALDGAVGQVLDYAGVESPFAVAEFTRFAQVLVATDRDHAEIGTITAEPKHFAPWRTVAPSGEDEFRFAPWRTVVPTGEDWVRKEIGVPEGRELTAQQILVAGVLRPSHLLTLVRDFTTETGRGSRTVKVVGRYQQFRAVHVLARNILDRREALAAGEDPGHRGGVIWHTQGSGKSLTMAFLVRYLRTHRKLSGQKVVVVTDRLDLEKQIRESLAATGETVHRARTVTGARKQLAVDVPDVVLVMIQKARKDDTADDGREESLGHRPGEELHVHNLVVNDSSDIVLLIDEAHRSHATWQHTRLRAMLPSAIFIGFTGTPILSGDRKTTEEIFGSFADTYTLRDAERDGAVVPVRYEAHNVPLEVIEKAALDAKFDEEVPEDPEQRSRVLRKFARRKEVLEAPAVIAAKADHMLRHWARTGLPDRFGAQVVAVSRRAAVDYRVALLEARDRLLEDLDAIEADLRHDPMAEENATPAERELLFLLGHRHVLASIDAAVVISKAQPGKRKDPDDWQPWTQKTRQDTHIERFKQGLGDPLIAAAVDPAWEAVTHGAPAAGVYGDSAGDPWEQDAPTTPDAGTEEMDGAEEDGEPIAFLVVQSMLLTGFDAPVEQTLYLDRPLYGAGLLQAIARTNRPYTNKEWGQVVDYIGIGPELARSLAEYDQADLRAVYGYDVSFDHLDPDHKGTQPTRDRMLLQADAAAEALLTDLHRQVTAFLRAQGIASLSDEARREDLLEALADPLLRGEFDELVRDFLTALNAVLPLPTALAYEDIARLLGETQYLARRRYLDGRDEFSPRRYGAKVRQLISRHLLVTEIHERVPSVELTDSDFMERVNANRDPRARVSYMTSSLRMRITASLASDRPRYQRFSDRLEEIVRQMGEDFERAAAEMADLVSDVTAAGAGEGGDAGLDPWTEQPVHGLLRAEFERTGGPDLPPGVDLIQAARELTVEMAGLVRSPDFVRLSDTRTRVGRELRNYLEDQLAMDWDHTGPLSSLLVELAVERHPEFVRYGRQTGR
ncbi:type I deoxyribonuclease HsdR [Streptomyces albireticuli]|uniref:type I site-specific deoxyribonuclease n=1 Tax=Streptomyces albireticuli TaxID=1940 RepID=A0A1Z2L0B8_9ACTN|nr:type I restriction endonuclease [Streptomyces albireticuli]ARZ67734.1 type I deoxyribonuclease HsdR [Streptomyces albireticuli]